MTAAKGDVSRAKVSKFSGTLTISSFFRHIITVGSGGSAAQLLTIVTIPILTRLYLPAAYAGWALLMSVVIIFSSIATLRYELAIVLPSSHEEAANVMTGCILITVITAFLSGLIFFGGRFWLLGVSFYAELKYWLWFMPLLIMAIGVYATCNAWCTRTQEFGWYSFSQVALPLFTVIFQIVAALCNVRTSSGLIFGTILGQICAVILLVGLIYRRYGSLILTAISGKHIIEAILKYKAYPLYMTPYTLVGTMRDRLVYFILANFGGKANLGFYNLSSRLVNMPNSLVSSAVRPVFFQHAASNDFKLFESQVNRALRTIAICVVPFWIIFLFHAQTLFALLFGEPWREAGLFAVILSVPAIPLLLGNWLDRAFDALGRQKLAFTMELFFSLLSVSGLLLIMYLSHDVILAIICQAAIMTVYYTFWIVALFYIAGYKWENLLSHGMIIVLICFASALVNWLLVVFLPVMYAIITSLIIATMFVGLYLFLLWRDLKKSTGPGK